MSIEQEKVIDFVGLDIPTGRVHLTISDHLAWDEFSKEHMLSLQKKINSYLSFIESGELLEKYPKYQGKPIVIQVIGKYPLSPEAEHFYEHAREAIINAGFEIQFKLLDE